MIQDFLEHLRWEYAINHFENTHKAGVENPELTEELGRYIKKYNTTGLMAALKLKASGITEEEERENRAMKSFRVVRAKKAQEVLEALDTLKPYLEEAFECAMCPPNSLMIKEIDISGWGAGEV